MTALCVSGHRSGRHSNLASFTPGGSLRRGLGCENPNFCPPTTASRRPFKASTWGAGSVRVHVCECILLSRALPRVLVTLPGLLIVLGSLHRQCVTALGDGQRDAVVAPGGPLACQTCLLCKTNQMFLLSLLFFQSSLLNSAQRRALWH